MPINSTFYTQIFLIGVYHPPGGNVESFLDELSDVIDSTLVFNNAEVNILGDFNIDYLNKQSSDTKHLFQWASGYGFSQFISQPTRVVLNNATCIDHLYTNRD